MRCSFAVGTSLSFFPSTQAWIILRKFSCSLAEALNFFSVLHLCVMFKTPSQAVMSSEATGTHGSAGSYSQVSLMLSRSVLGHASINGSDSQDSCFRLPVLCALFYSKHICSGWLLDWIFPCSCTDCISGSSVNSSLLTGFPIAGFQAQLVPQCWVFLFERPSGNVMSVSKIKFLALGIDQMRLSRSDLNSAGTHFLMRVDDPDKILSII